MWITAAAVTALVMSMTLFPPVDSGFTAPTHNGANTFSSAGCFYRASVQSGATTSTTNGPHNVTISAVDPAKAFLLFSTRHDSNRPVGSQVSGRIVDSTTLEFQRATNEASPVTITIEWSIVEYGCGVSVQRGSVAPAATITNVTVAAVNSLTSAFVTWSKLPNPTSSTWGGNDPLVGELTSTTNLQLRQDLADATSTIYWQVIEFTDPTKINVQKGSTSLTGTATSTTATLATPVDPARTFVLAAARRPGGGGGDIGSGMVRARLTNATTITLDRSATNYNITEISWQAVELRDGSTVQSGSATLTTGVATATAALTTVNSSRTTAFLSTQTGGGQNGGRTPYVAGDIIGVACATATVTNPTLLTLTRTSTASSADFTWYVITWGAA